MLISKNVMDFLKTQALIKGLSDGEIIELAPFLEVSSYKLNDIVFHEAENSKDIYLILEGTVSLVKNPAHLLGKLSKGAAFGEMSFLDDSPRSCTVRSDGDLLLVKINHNGLYKGPSQVRDIYSKIICNIAKIVIERLRNANKASSQSKKIEERNLHVHAEYSHLFLNILLPLITFGGLLGLAYNHLVSLSYFPMLNWISLLALIIPIGLFTWRHNFPLKKFGLYRARWTRSLERAVLYSFAAILICLVFIFVLNLFGFSAAIPKSPPSAYLVLMPVYILLSEFIFRGVVQRITSRFLIKSPVSSAFYVAAMVSAVNLCFGIPTALLVFGLHYSCGLYYALHKNLFGAALLHLAILGTLRMGGYLAYSSFT